MHRFKPLKSQLEIEQDQIMEDSREIAIIKRIQLEYTEHRKLTMEK